MKKKRILLGILMIVALLAEVGCFRKKTDWSVETVPPNTLILEFSRPLKYVMDLQIDGQNIPVRFSNRNKILRVEGLASGAHHFNIHSISYVFGPEFSRIHTTDEQGAFVFVLARKYRSALPKERRQVSIRAYHKMLKETKALEDEQAIRAYFE